MKLFAKTDHCLSRAHCRTCRDREGGQGWRQILALSFTLPSGAPDFECPHGLEWGATPERVAAEPEPAYVADRRAACDACDVPEEKCSVKMRRKLKPCWYVAYTRRLGAVCLADPPKWPA